MNKIIKQIAENMMDELLILFAIGAIIGFQVAHHITCY